PFLTSDWCLPRRNVDSNRVDRHLLSQSNPSFATIMNWSRGLHLCMYYLVMGVISFALYALDKWKAVNGMWRIPERVLLTSTAIGGFIGSAAGMILCHHKTQKSLFWIVLIGSSVIWVVITICVI
ncbi:hypothetical protein WA588_002805, partial [Blastocystis sp. NMH]